MRELKVDLSIYFDIDESEEITNEVALENAHRIISEILSQSSAEWQIYNAETHEV